MITCTHALTGGSTMTWNAQALVLPHRSLAVQVTVLAPTGNNEPLGGVHWIGTGPG